MDAEFFDRAPETLGKTAERSSLPIEQKESFRWLQGDRSACELATECPETQIVSIADREADIDDNVVLVEEVGGPGDDTDVSWLLITRLPIETIDQVFKIIDDDVARWTVDVDFRTLKTGCRVEDIPLETTRRLKNCLAFYKIIAWRVLHLTSLNRTCPTLPCTAVFDDSEWKSVWRVVAQKPLPKPPPRRSPC